MPSFIVSCFALGVLTNLLLGRYAPGAKEQIDAMLVDIGAVMADWIDRMLGRG